MKRENYIECCTGHYTFSSIKGTETSTIHSKYRPFYTIVQNSSIINEQNKLFIYGIPTIDITNTVSNYGDLIYALQMGGYFIKYTSRNKDFTVVAGRGFILDDRNQFLLLLVAEVEKENQPEYDRLFVSYKLFDPKYKKLYKEVYENLISPALEEGVPMEVISSEKIQDTVFKPILRTLNDFKTIEEYEKYIELELDKEFFEEAKLLIPVERDVIEIERIVQKEVYGAYSEGLTKESLEKAIEDILKLCELTENIFVPTSNIIEQYLENPTTGELKLEEVGEDVLSD